MLETGICMDCFNARGDKSYKSNKSYSDMVFRAFELLSFCHDSHSTRAFIIHSRFG